MNSIFSSCRTKNINWISNTFSNGRDCFSYFGNSNTHCIYQWIYLIAIVKIYFATNCWYSKCISIIANSFYYTTTKLKVGTGIALVIQRDPIVTAKMVSSIDQLSNGRFLFGVGNGWNQPEIENHGTAFKTRHKLARERIEAMKAIWANEEPEYHGEFVNFDKMKQWPKPRQTPHPPIIVGGGFPHAARRAIRYGDGWIPRDDWLEKDGMGVIDQFHQMATEAGRDPASLPISVFRVPDNIERLRLCEKIGIDRIVFSLPAEKEDKILPILDRWYELKKQLVS